MIKKSTLSFILLLFIADLSFCQFIPDGSVWKYLDNGSNQGTAWYTPDFNDNNWPEGAAKLGYGVDNLGTEIGFGDDSTNRYITYYFRKTFMVENTDDINLLMLGLLCDDGGVVYINGEEVVRHNMPEGEIDYLTEASKAVYGESEDAFFIYQFPPDVLQTGKNTIAVEVHQRSKMSNDVAFDLRLDFGEYSAFHKSPYLLFPANNTEMILMWQADSTRSCTFEWGIDTLYTNGLLYPEEYGNDHQYKVELNDLDPGTHYFYRVTLDTITSKKGSFYTGVPDETTSICWYAYGDTRSNPAIHDKVAEQMWLDLEQSSSESIVLTTGDMVYDGSEEEYWDYEWFNPNFKYIQKLLANLPYLNTIGNHLGNGYLFQKYYPYPMITTNRFYYSFDYGPAHFIILDQYTSYSQGSTQYEWLVNDLLATNKKWKFMFLHEPGWSAGGHSNSKKVQNIIQPLCKQYDIQFVFSGHNHYYSRAVVNGIYHITTAGGGAPLYSPDENKPNIVKISRSTHFCKVEIDGDSLTFTAIKSDGTVIESFRTGFIPDKVFYQQNDLADYFKVFSKYNYISIVNIKNVQGMYSIFDSWGRVVHTGSVNTHNQSIKIETPGIYFVRFDINGKRFVKKILVN